jgi:hypothetical protein
MANSPASQLAPVHCVNPDIAQDLGASSPAGSYRLTALNPRRKRPCGVAPVNHSPAASAGK